MNTIDAVNSPAPRVVVVEDDGGMRILLMRTLSENGFRASGARDGYELRAALEAAPADLILLDLMLPGINGLDLCRSLRQSNDVPIIILTARGDELDRVLGLELGAGGYLGKPFSHRELLARIRAVLRRGRMTPHGGSNPSGGNLRFARWTLNIRRRELIDPEGSLVELSGAEYELLVSFLENPQRIFGRDRLLELSRTSLGDVSDRSVDVLVSRLRRKLGGDVGPTIIRTVRGVGYIFVVDVSRE
jgi:two-component system OmpR family response regulator